MGFLKTLWRVFLFLIHVKSDSFLICNLHESLNNSLQFSSVLFRKSECKFMWIMLDILIFFSRIIFYKWQSLSFIRLNNCNRNSLSPVNIFWGYCHSESKKKMMFLLTVIDVFFLKYTVSLISLVPYFIPQHVIVSAHFSELG